MADQGGNPTDQIVDMFDPSAHGAQAPDWQAMGQQAVAAIPNNISGFGGGWSLSEHEMESLIKRLERLKVKLNGAKRRALPMSRIDPPADEPHSRRVAQVMKRSGGEYIKSLESQLKYVLDLQDSMQKSLDRYRGVEHDNSEAVANADSRLEGTL